MAFQIRYTERAQEAIEAMNARDRAIVLAGVRAQLTEAPLVETRNRKPMRPSLNIVALGITWELRIVGTWRVFYDVEAEIVTVNVIDIVRKGRQTTDEVLGRADEEEDP